MTDMLSQEEIDALLGGGDESSASESEASMSSEEKDAIGEIGNISMGTAATTLFTLLGQKVTITTPRVFETNIGQLKDEFVEPCVIINIVYKVGIEGVNLLIMDTKDVKIITDLMMGGDGTNTDGELTDLHLSAIGEAMNQMIGSASTSLSEMLGSKIDISPPEALHKDIKEYDYTELGLQDDDQLVKIAFRMTVGDLIDSEIMQVIPVSVAKQMISNFVTPDQEGATSDIIEEPVITPEQPVQQQPMQQQPMQQQPMQQQPMQQQPNMGQANVSYTTQQQAPQMPPNAGMYQNQYQQPNINAQQVAFENFGGNLNEMYYNNDIELIKEVPLEITVELGRTGRKINEILDFGVGTVIELDRLVGEPLDIMANGKKIAVGEVVVVDENYGVKITEIVSGKIK